MKFKINVIRLLMINLVLFFLLPILSFFIFAIELMVLKEKKIRKIAIIFFCLSIGIMGYVSLPPINFDLYRHFEAYENLKGITFFKMSNLEWFKNKEFFYTIVWIFGRLGISKHFLPFISIYIFYFGILIIVEEYFNENMKTNNLRLLYASIVLLLMNLEYITFISQVRGPVAAGLLFIGYYLIVLKEKNKRGIIFMFLSCLLHFAMIPLVILFFLIEIKFINVILEKYKILLLLSAIGLYFFSHEIIIFIRNFVPAFYQKKIDIYYLGKWAHKASSAHKYEIIYTMLYFYIIVLIFFDNTSKKIKNYLLLIILFISFNIMSRTNFLRYMWYTRAFQYGYILYDASTTSNKKIRVIKVLVLSIFMVLYMLLGIRIYYQYIKTVFYPLFKNLFQIFILNV